MPAVIKIAPQPTKKTVLGRGLGALIADARVPVTAGAAGAAQAQLAIADIRPDRANPRKDFDEAELEALAQSLKNQGMLQPVLVRRDGAGGYRLIAGERRWRAAQRAGLAEIPAVVREATDAEAYELALVENIQRADLNPIEEAEAYRRLIEERKLTQEQVADRVGKERSTVANALRLLSLPNEVKQLLIERDLDMGHARAILGLAKPQEMVAMAREAVTEGLSVRATEARVKVLRGERGPGGAARSDGRHAREAREVKASPEARRLVEDVQRRLGTKVRLTERGEGKGTLEIDYFSYEDLDRILAFIRR